MIRRTIFSQFSCLRPTTSLNLGFNLGHRRTSFRFIKKLISYASREFSSLQSDVPIIFRPSMMYCRSCEQTQTAGRIPCTTVGQCGKCNVTSSVMDLLRLATLSLAQRMTEARRIGVVENIAMNRFLPYAIYATSTNVQFDVQKLASLVQSAVEFRESIHLLYQHACVSRALPPVKFSNAMSFLPESYILPTLNAAGQTLASLHERQIRLGVDACSLLELSLHASTGLASALVQIDRLMAFGNMTTNTKYPNDSCLEAIYVSFQELLSAIAPWIDYEGQILEPQKDQLLALVFRVGELYDGAMRLKDEVEERVFGSPSPQKVSWRPCPGKAILVSGHDMVVLSRLLQVVSHHNSLNINKSTSFIRVYTHGDLISAHGYPAFTSYVTSGTLAGHYGGAWHEQQVDFASFPGAVVVTSDLMEPLATYRTRVFTSGTAGWPAIPHLWVNAPLIAQSDFVDAINVALDQLGFAEIENISNQISSQLHSVTAVSSQLPSVTAVSSPSDSWMVGHHHRHVVNNLVPEMANALADGRLAWIFVVGGGDTENVDREYFNKFAEALPENVILMTFGSLKFRFRSLSARQHSKVPGTSLPRMNIVGLLDLGNGSDLQSALTVMHALARTKHPKDELPRDVDVDTLNQLPMSIMLSLFDQTVIVQAISLVQLGIKNVRLGTALPVYITPEVLAIFMRKYGVKLVVNPKRDVKLIMLKK